MGAIADAIMAYAEPLLEQTDGSEEGLQRALNLTTVCYNLAILPDASREKAISDLQSSFKLNDQDFGEFRREVIDPMIRRHNNMFPPMDRWLAPAGSQRVASARDRQSAPAAADIAPKTDRYAPCPCNSGEKYKFCCGAKKR